MNIIICGAGRVGFTIAKLLSEQNHSITVIDQSSEDIQKIKDTLDLIEEELKVFKEKNPNLNIVDKDYGTFFQKQKNENNLYDNSIVFQYYIKSNTKPFPGKGNGETIPVDKIKDFSKLKDLILKLSNNDLVLFLDSDEILDKSILKKGSLLVPEKCDTAKSRSPI